MSEIKLKCAVCGTEFKPKKEMRYTGKTYGEDIFHDCYDCPNCGAQYVAQKRIKEVRKISDDLISREAIIEAVDRHTREDGTLDDDITIILEEVKTAFDKGRVIEEIRNVPYGYYNVEVENEIV